MINDYTVSVDKIGFFAVIYHADVGYKLFFPREISKFLVPSRSVYLTYRFTFKSIL